MEAQLWTACANWNVAKVQQLLLFNPQINIHWKDKEYSRTPLLFAFIIQKFLTDKKKQKR